MKGRLIQFSDFAESLLPLEASFLLDHQKFEDEQKTLILQQLCAVAEGKENIDVFDPTLDKRKFSYVKRWSSKILAELDVDENLRQVLEWERLILTDSLPLTEEKSLLRVLATTQTSDFNFLKIYDVARTYRHYLQIRMRYKDYQSVHQFLTRYRTDYEFSRLVNDKLHESTLEIISDYGKKQKVNYEDTFPWLKSLFYNQNLDGYNRLLAWIRMVFIAHNKKSYDMLAGMFEYFETLVRKGTLYSRRIVTNFYSQYLLFYASRQDFANAARCGYLSIKENNNDYLYYVNNLAAVLLRDGRPEEALKILKRSAPIAKTALNQHNKIGHAAYTVFALVDTGQARQAENHAFVFATAFIKEIFDHRWHLFFTAWFKAMLWNGNYRNLLRLWSLYKLETKNNVYAESSNYSPSLPWMYQLAMFKNGDIDLLELQTKLPALWGKDQQSSGAFNRTDLLEISRKVLKNDFGKLQFVGQN